jgi:putative nucleotidyltransferase with HDIG domain
MDILKRHQISPLQAFLAIFSLLLLTLFCKVANFPLVIPFLLLFLGGHLFLFQKGNLGLVLRMGLLLSLLTFVAFALPRYHISTLYIPIASVALLTALLYKDLQLAFVMALASALIVTLCLHEGLNYFLIFLLGSLIGVYLVRDARTRGQLFRAALGISVVQVVVQVLLSLDPTAIMSPDYVKLFIKPLALNGFISVAILFSLKIFESLFGELTNFSLMELSDFNQPLLRRMILEAPGTYHHSLVVSNLAEAAADAIGANGLLARVGAYYHDIGKMEKAEYFTENQIAIDNKHDDIEPSMSKLVILNHVRDGIELAKKYKLNPKIIDFIPQHHGTTLMYYFYQRALEEAEDTAEVKEENYRYPGPKPQTKETAIVLLADSAEAATRSLEEPSPHNIAEVVRKVINNKFIDAQLDESNLTLKEIEIIAETFSRILSAMHHSRVRYPEIKNA